MLFKHLIIMEEKIDRYNIIKAQEEAEKLQQKIKSGEALNYGDAEKLIEKEEMINWLKRGYIDDAFKIKEQFNVSEEIAQSAAKEEMINWLKRGYIDDAFKIKEQFNVSEEIAQSAAKEEMINWLKRGCIYDAFKIKEQFNVSEEIAQTAAKEGMINSLKSGHIDDAFKIKEKFNISGEVIQSSEVQSIAKEEMINWLKSGYIDDAFKIKEKFNISGEVIQSSEVQSIVKEEMINRLKGGHIDDAFKIKEQFNVSEEIAQSAAKEEMINWLKRGYIDDAFKIKEQFNVSEEIAQSAAKEEMINWLKSDYIYDAFKIKEKFNISGEVIQSSEVQSIAKEGMINRLKSGYIDDAFKIKEQFNVSEEIAQSAAKEGMINRLKSGHIDDAFKIKEKFNISGEVIQSSEVQTAAKEMMIVNIKKGNADQVFKIKEDFNVSEEVLLSPSIQNIIRLVRIFNNDNRIASLETSKTDINSFTEDDLGELFKKAKIELSEWQDEQTVAGPFQAGAEIFGYKQMLEYMRRGNLSLHDAVHAFRDVLELYKASGLSGSEFYGQVLHQVRMDDREYPEGTAHHHFNAIAQTANKNVAAVMERVQKYKEIERLQELATIYNNPKAVFASWVNLKRYSELEQLLGKTKVLDELKKLKIEGKDALYKYIETLAFHPDSKVNMSAVMQFWRDPKSFLAAKASHTPYEVHDRKKPSNYLNMPNLDLTASELRDALVEGKMDGLSVFTPLEIKYTIPMEDIKSELSPDLISKALGSNKKGIEGMAKNSRKLFSEFSKLLKPYGINIVEYIQGKSLPDSVNLSQEIEALLYNSDFGIERPSVKTREFVARINQKSDPEGSIAGDDTVNCMPFGDGKNTVYTFNPNTAQFVIRIIKGDGKERTIAQSVLTKDMDIQTLVPDVISKLQQEGGHLEDILPADILTAAPVYAACDNVEVAPNYSNERHQQIIEAIFRDFFKEYMKRYAGTEGLNPKKVPIGQGYTDALSQLPTEENTFVPQAPVSYSDKTGGNVYMLDLEGKTETNLIWQKQVRETEIERPIELVLPKMKGLGYLTFEDALKVAYLEGKAYSDNQSLMQFLFNMENGLIAKDINNVAKNRPNMSLKYTDENKRMRGYMLAWEGRLSDKNVEYNAGEFFDQSCIYIIDIATDRENHMAGGRLMKGFAELYKQNYLDKGNPIPIFAQAREATSYQIVKRHLDKIGKDIGFDFELIELPTYEVEEDLMHPIIIRPVSKKK
jgi:hypothetical protein